MFDWWVVRKVSRRFLIGFGIVLLAELILTSAFGESFFEWAISLTHGNEEYADFIRNAMRINEIVGRVDFWLTVSSAISYLVARSKTRGSAWYGMP
jgi:hypothetical protein